MATKLSKVQRNGLFYAFLGVFAFSLSLPFTKLALKSFDPLFTAFARPVIAALIAIPFMFIAKVPQLPRELWRPTAFTTGGAVFGWPILIALALQRTTSAHVSVIAAVMPLVTAIIAVIKHRKHPGPSFWIASTLGTALLVAFSISRGGSSNSDLLTDLLIFGAVIASSYCYVEGASLTSFSCKSSYRTSCCSNCLCSHPFRIFIAWGCTLRIIRNRNIFYVSRILCLVSRTSRLRCRTWISSPATSSHHDARLVSTSPWRNSHDDDGFICSRHRCLCFMGTF